MSKLTGTKHGDAANELLTFYQSEADRLETSGSYFMAAVALGAALETALLTFMLVESDEENGAAPAGIPANLLLDDLIDAAKQLDILGSVKFQGVGEEGPRSVEDVVREIQGMRNNLHPGKALRTHFDPAAFDAVRYQRLRAIYMAVMDNLLYHI